MQHKNHVRNTEKEKTSFRQSSFCLHVAAISFIDVKDIFT